MTNEITKNTEHSNLRLKNNELEPLTPNDQKHKKSQT